MRKEYYVAREFIGGLLKGLSHTERTSVEFKVGFVCRKPCGGSSPYKVTAVKPVVI